MKKPGVKITQVTGQGSFSGFTHTWTKFTMKSWAESLALMSAIMHGPYLSELNYCGRFNGNICERPALVCHGPQLACVRSGCTKFCSPCSWNSRQWQILLFSMVCVPRPNKISLAHSSSSPASIEYRPTSHYCFNFLQTSKSAHPIDRMWKVFNATWCKVSLYLHRNDVI